MDAMKMMISFQENKPNNFRSPFFGPGLITRFLATMSELKVKKSKKSKKQTPVVAAPIQPSLSSFLLAEVVETDSALDNIFATSVSLLLSSLTG